MRKIKAIRYALHISRLALALPVLILLSVVLAGGARGQSAVVPLEIAAADSMSGAPIAKASVKVRKGPSCRTDSSGTCRVRLAPGEYLVVVVADGYNEFRAKIKIAAEDTLVRLRAALKYYSLRETEVTDERNNTDKNDLERPSMVYIETEGADKIPTIGGGAESLILTLPGVGAVSEFSSQYRVRGGNYDENLIYINDVEVYRPLIVRTGQQEGLSITNTDLIKDIGFSSGGFASRYGDKLSSVLDITYKTPQDFKASAEAGLITANAHVEGTLFREPMDTTDWTQLGRREPGQVTFLFGARRFSTEYVLNSLDVQGDYRPEFWDAQGYFTFTPRALRRSQEPVYRTRKNGETDTIYRPRDPWKFSWLSLASRSRFQFFPSTRETTFGTINRGFRLFMAFVGQEQTNYTTAQNAVVAEHTPSFRLKMKYIVSHVVSEESELTSTEGGYRLADVSTDFGSDDFGEVLAVRGVGTQIRNARNYLSVNMLTFSHKGRYFIAPDFNKEYQKSKPFIRHTLEWGADLRYEYIDDAYREWEARDSAEFVTIDDVISANNIQESYRVSGYLQDVWRTGKSTNLNFGARFNYWTLNEQLLISPRAQFVFDPSRKFASPDSAAADFQLRASIGLYAQPPFFRELRNFRGRLFPETRAQRSVHYIVGGDYLFKLWGRDFKFFAEGYYKQLMDIIPFEIQNVRLRYYPEETARGYAYGADLRLVGQFIEDVDSWLSFAYLDTREDVESLTDQGLVRRPSDQRVMVGAFFKDYWITDNTFEMHMNLIYNTGLPFGFPETIESRTFFEAPSYLRLDIGVSKLFIVRATAARTNHIAVKSIWVGLDVFNILGRDNVVSYTWIDDIYDTQFAVPNFLSSRLLNLRVIVNLD